jgi:hypothetical protein
MLSEEEVLAKTVASIKSRSRKLVWVPHPEIPDVVIGTYMTTDGPVPLFECTLCVYNSTEEEKIKSHMQSGEHLWRRKGVHPYFKNKEKEVLA